MDKEKLCKILHEDIKDEVNANLGYKKLIGVDKKFAEIANDEADHKRIISRIINRECD